MVQVQRRLTRVVVVASVLATAVACGGNSDGAGSPLDPARTDQVGDSDEGTDGEVVVSGSIAPTPIVVGETIVGLHGADEGVAATLYALDAGYSIGQLSTAALDGSLAADGSIPDVAPAGPDHGVIAAPVESMSRAADSPERSAEDVYREIDRKLATVATINLLGAPLGVFGDISYEAVFPSEPELDPNTKEAAAATIGVMAALVDMGYSLDQVVNGFVFGELSLAMGADRSGEENPQTFSIDGAPVAPCFVLRDSAGEVIAPTESGARVLLGSTTCARAVRDGTISFDGIDRLRRGADAETTDAGTDVVVDGGDSADDAAGAATTSSSAPEQAAPVDDPATTEPAQSGDTTVEPAGDPAEWRLAATNINPLDAPTEFVVGVTPDYYESPRFDGTFSRNTVSATAMVGHDRSVEREYQYYDMTTTISIVGPPATMASGDTITLEATGTASGPFDGVANPGWRFSFESEGSVALEGERGFAVGLNPEYYDERTVTVTPSFVVPIPRSSDDEFRIHAFGQCDACWVEWIFRPDSG